MLKHIVIKIRGFCHNISQYSLSRKVPWLWRRLKPAYEKAVELFFYKGIPCNINGNRMLLLPKYCDTAQTYEAEVFSHLMAQVRPGDVVAEIGGYIGIYTIPLARKVGLSGKVIVFEPEPNNFYALRTHIRLNKVIGQVELLQFAASDQEGSLNFPVDGFCSSYVISEPLANTQVVKAARLDSILKGRKLDIMKIDVEGFEERVIRGGQALLKDNNCSPRLIYIEAHPQFWPRYATTSATFLEALDELGYEVRSLRGRLLNVIDQYSEVVALKKQTNP